MDAAATPPLFLRLCVAQGATMAIEYLDGGRYREIVVAGADWVRQTREHLNRINVFPVPDGDTGTNLALSLSATAAAVRGRDERSLADVALRAAEASILNAKGNSGTIMAHWFLGMSNAFQGQARTPVAAIGVALQRATAEVYGGIDRPVEGTVISVMRAVSEAAAGWTRVPDLAQYMEALLDIAREALARTPDQLQVLRESHVVDAGAQGYVNFLEGATRRVRGEPPPLREEDLDSVVDHGVMAHDVQCLDGRFCTEVVVRGSRFDAGDLRTLFRPMGSSVLVATTGSVFKLHIHTDHPDEVLRVAARQGTVEERKVDDMLVQSEERVSAAVTPIIDIGEQPAAVAVVCDSAGDIPLEVRRELGVEMASMQVLFGDQVFRDQVDLSTEEFYSKLASDAPHPTTSQPAPREFVQALERVRKDREVVLVTVSAGLSGTFKSARSAVELVEHPRVEVFDSASASIGTGMMVMNAARLAARGATVDEVLSWLTRWREDTGMLFSLQTLEYLRRGGRIGAASSFIGGLLGLRPILTLEQGQVQPLARARGEEEVYRKVARTLTERIPEGTRLRLGLVKIQDDGGQTDALEAFLNERYEIIDLQRGAPTGVVGAHAGPGAWGVFYQRVRDDDPLLQDPAAG
jgi:DegV family protein with EDD domain